MKYYSPIHLENIDIIQQKVFDIFPKSELSCKEKLFYIPDNLKIFFNIPELKSELDNINWSQYDPAEPGYFLHHERGWRNC